jgi:hypothetical protein
VTPTLSEAENPDTGTVKVVDVDGKEKLFTTGRVVSETTLSTKTVTDNDCDEFPALSKAMAFMIYTPLPTFVVSQLKL